MGHGSRDLLKGTVNGPETKYTRTSIPPESQLTKGEVQLVVSRSGL